MQFQKSPLILSWLFVFFAAIAAFAQVNEQSKTEFDHSRIEKTQMFMRGTKSFPSSITNASTSFGSRDLRETPPWPAEDSTPPLSPRDAVLIAQRSTEEWYSGHDDISWMLTEIALVPLESEKGKWYWQAKLEVKKAGRKSNVEMVIRMDGTVLTQVNAPGRK